MIVSSLVYIFFASANPQPWGISHSDNNEKDDNIENEEKKNTSITNKPNITIN
jgi:hypothetical protein